MATFSLIAANNDNSTLLRAGSGWVDSIDFYNPSAAIRYVKLYDKATAPGASDTPLLRIGIPAGGRDQLSYPERELVYGAGLGVRIVTGQPDNDNTAPTAGDVVINIVYR